MIDLHCHVLPGIDDGPETIEASVALGQAAARAGLRTLVATPHVSWRYVNGPKVIREGVEAVGDAFGAAGVGIEVRQGAEIATARLGDLSDEELCELRLGAGPWLLIESPLSPGVGDLESMLERLQRRGHWIVLAHPERCPMFLRDPRRLGALVSSGILCSVTASSLVGAFGGHVRRFALRLLEEGLVHNVCSDAHDAARRPPVIGGDIVAASAHVPGLLARAEWLTDEIPRAILEGEPLPRSPGPPLPRTSAR